MTMKRRFAWRRRSADWKSSLRTISKTISKGRGSNVPRPLCGSIRFCLDPVDRASPSVLRAIPFGDSMFDIDARSTRSKAVNYSFTQ